MEEKRKIKYTICIKSPRQYKDKEIYSIHEIQHNIYKYV